jgi:mevalonate kinase
VAVATIRACASLEERFLEPGTVSDLAHRVEALHHGTPSGIDNTVVAHEKPIVFVRSKPPRFLPASPFTLVFADSGIRSKTLDMVGALARRRDEDPGPVDRLFDGIEAEVLAIIDGLAARNLELVGKALLETHGILAALEVSCEELDALVGEAMRAGALGAKLSGAGGGGYMLALAPDSSKAESIARALRKAGGTGVFVTSVGGW